MTRTGLRLGGFSAVDGELIVDLGLWTTDLVLLIGGVLFDEVLGWRFLGWRFDDFSGLVFSCWFGFDEFFMFWRFRWRIGILYEILHYSGFDCTLVLGLIVLGFGKNMKIKFLCS